jgi:putative salt-induced outer membrane protein YdiY
MDWRKSIVIMCTVLFAGTCYSDELKFKNGDRLTGKIKNLVEGKLIIDTDVMGEVTVELSKIQTFSSDSPIKVHLKDGTVLNQKVLSSDPNYFAIQAGEELQAQQFKFDSIASINPPPKPKPKWTGNLSAGITSVHGNTKIENITASANMSRRTEKDRIRLSADYAKSEQEDPVTKMEQTTEDWWRSRATYDYFFTKKFFGYLDGRYEKDSIADLDRRVIVGAGGGYQWIESEKMNFSTMAGLASLYEKFDNQTESNSEISLQLGCHLDKQLTKTIKFVNDTTYYPSLEKFSDYYLTTTAELRANFTDKFFTNFKTIFDYDVTPAIGRGSTDVKYIWGIGYAF